MWCNLFLCIVLIGCLNQVSAMGPLSPLDPSSYSRPELAIIKHISMTLNVDFGKKVLDGSAILHFDIIEEVFDLILDVSKLHIEYVAAADGSRLQHEVSEHVPNFGAKLTIHLPTSATTGDKLNITIKYSTDPTASALQWLEPEQTLGKKYPYVYSSCYPIHARSIVPCQDTPAVKFTYDAHVTAPAHYTVLMSALRSTPRHNTTTFTQPMPVASYLLAIAIGALESRTIGPRSKVWSENAEIERAAWEFAETEKYLSAAERLCGPYEWTQYDLLVLPPPFPYDAMENPCLTFVPPTLLAGDRSQADVIVHEIMHSWTGNLVTNRNFEHFWLNEGFTVFLERKVAASLIADAEQAKRSRDFESLLGLQELNETVQTLGESSPLTHLVTNLNQTHPDDAYSRVPYEKGSLFLRYLEDLVGGPAVFDNFVRLYVSKYRLKTVDTDQFKEHLLEYFKNNEQIKTVDWDTWFYASGMPIVIPDYDTSLSNPVNAVVAMLQQTDEPPSGVYLTPHQLVHLLQQMLEVQAWPVARLRAVGEAYNLTSSHNSEIQFRWLRLCIKSRDSSALNTVYQFINNQGRMRYVRPIYRDLYDWDEVREQAIANFLQNEKYMTHVAAYALRKDLHLRD